MHHLKVWMSILISIAVGLITMALVQIFMVPRQRRKVLLLEPYINQPMPSSVSSIENGKNSSIIVNSMSSSTNSMEPIMKMDEKEEEKRVNLLFHFIQILAAIFSSFAHGGNDVANAIGPLITVWLVYTHGSVGSKAETPIYILAYGGFGIVFGLWIFGRRVIETVGTNLTKITPATGVTIESGSAVTVLMASKIGVPISTTHCKVGAVTFVGWVYGKTFNNVEEKDATHVNWKLFAGIFSAWVITLPAAGGISALLMYCFQFLL